MAMNKKEDEIKKVIENEIKNAINAQSMKQRSNKKAIKGLNDIESEEELSDEGDFFIRDRT